MQAAVLGGQRKWQLPRSQVFTSISILEKKIKMFNDGTNSKNWGGPESAVTVVVVFFTLAENEKLDVLIRLIRIQLKKGLHESFLSNKPINLKLRVFEMGYCFVITIVYVTNLLTTVLSICLINYCSIDGSLVATCRIEWFGFEPWSGAALRSVLGQVTLISQCLSPPRYITGFRQT